MIDFPTSRGRPHPILLARPHCRAACYQRAPGRVRPGCQVHGPGALHGPPAARSPLPRRRRAIAVSLDRVPPAEHAESLAPTRRVPQLVPGALLLVALGGCNIKHPTVGPGQRQTAVRREVRRLPHARPRRPRAGTVGPNLDDAFRQDRADGVKSTSIQGLVGYWIQYPNTEGVMPRARLVRRRQDAQDVAAYVAHVAAVPGQDVGALATAVPSSHPEAGGREERGRRDQRRSERAAQVPGLERERPSPGRSRCGMQNMSSVPHDIAIKGGGVSKIGKIVYNGGVSTVTVTLKPGSYTFYCSVDGHAAAGMRGRSSSSSARGPARLGARPQPLPQLLAAAGR